MHQERSSEPPCGCMAATTVEQDAQVQEVALGVVVDQHHPGRPPLRCAAAVTIEERIGVNLTCHRRAADPTQDERAD